MRYVSCRDNQGGVADESACAHLPKPPAREVCSVVACGQWKVLEWTAVRESPLITAVPDRLSDTTELLKNPPSNKWKFGKDFFHHVCISLQRV